MKLCVDCKWYSIKIMSQGKALCLNVRSPRYGTVSCKGCPEYERGRAVDDPRGKYHAPKP